MSADDLASFDRLFKSAGVPPMPATLRYTQWDEYVAALNNMAAGGAGRSPGFVYAFPPPNDPYGEDREAWAKACREHTRRLKDAIAAGRIEARRADTRVPVEPGETVRLANLVLNFNAVQAFAHELAIEAAQADEGGDELPGGASTVAEAPQERPTESEPQRRLRRLRDLGGEARWLNQKWEFRGINALIQAEIDHGLGRRSTKTVRADLVKAAEAERQECRAGTQLPTWPPKPA